MAKKGELPDSFSTFLKGAKFGKGKGSGPGMFGKKKKSGRRGRSMKGRGKIQAEALSKKGEMMEEENEVNTPA